MYELPKFHDIFRTVSLVALPYRHFEPNFVL